MLAVTASLLALAVGNHSFRHSKFRFADIMENRKNDLCLDGHSLPTVTESWCRGQVGDDESSLCLGVASILNATCAELLDEEFLQQVARRVGLVNDFRGARIFGAEAKHMRRAATKTEKGKRPGMFQDPHQLAAALVHLGRSPIPIRTYLELGVLSAWSNAIISAFLKRKAEGRHEFHSYAVDNSRKFISKPTLIILSALNGNYVDRASQTYKQMIAESQTSPRFDVCFIDADHSYDGVRADYEELKRRCVRMMFHDVTDFDCFIIDGFGGGVPAFWAELVLNVNRSRVNEFTAQPGIFPPVLGIGVISPSSATGDGQADSSAWQRAPMGAGFYGRKAGFYTWLCSSGAARANSTPLQLFCKP